MIKKTGDLALTAGTEEVIAVNNAKSNDLAIHNCHQPVNDLRPMRGNAGPAETQHPHENHNSDRKRQASPCDPSE